MHQSTSTVNEHHSTAVAEPNVTLPQIVAKKNLVDGVPHSKASDEKNECCLPSIVDKTGSNMMSILIGKRMEQSNTPSSDLRLVVYESLEQRRAHKIGVKPLRNFDVTRSKRCELLSGRHSLPPIMTASSTPAAPHLQPLQTSANDPKMVRRGNTLAPFTTMAPKPTCGFYFNRETLNKKVRIGVPPSDLVKWRTDYSLFPQPQKQN